ncbi:hypothetical protein FF011L_37750 [Roseimaritima multifibrata]|uniref:Cytochrome c domain-containing protein n=1 Tax=Roseimaritima multifibrata TaxID=1930274 RepID=A0A517MJB4_9BACT|nr:DUF1592 domain-containing protein [Roseimaritima multifibrata]QDS94991.1 hypothetical protein FF011L_37750 [Roseimaritima multifibrata]
MSKCWGICFVLCLLPLKLTFAEAAADGLQKRFARDVLPVVKAHCVECHDAETEAAGLNLVPFSDTDSVVQSHSVWEEVLDQMESGDMPPEDVSQPLVENDRAKVVRWVKDMLQQESAKQAGDPGPVYARRLSNAEYDYSIRDLTGFDLRPTSTFPVDPANEAGFDNSGESLRMSPALIKKGMDAARMVAEHLVLTPAGIRFAPHPVATDTDRDKYCVNRIVQFYKSQPTDYADYFFAAWQFQYRKELGKPEATLESIAADNQISETYLALVWETLQQSGANDSPLARLHQMFSDLPAPAELPTADDSYQPVKIECDALADYVEKARKWFEPEIEGLKVTGVHSGSQAFVLWKNGQYARHRRRPSFQFLNKQENKPAKPESEAKSDPKAESDELNVDEFSLPSKEQRKSFEADCERFCSTFPDAFYVSERGRDYLGIPKEKQQKGRLLNAGFHSMMGYYRDDQPLVELVLDADEKQQLDRLWEELDFIASAPQRQFQGMLWFERTDSGYMRDPEFDFARPEDKASLRADSIAKLSDIYLHKAKANGAGEIAVKAIEKYFDDISAQIRWVETTRSETESIHVESMIQLAAQAFRRDLQPNEIDSFRSFYRDRRETDHLSHEEAMQDLLVSILMSPHFSYRVDLLCDSDNVRALTDIELASRLSFFLWSSLPDEELRQAAASGKLHEPEVLLAQTRRMLQDPKVRGLALEFGGNWLDIRRFEEHNSVDRERFPEFNDSLRQAMLEEPIRFLIDMFQSDRPLEDLIDSSRTFVNQPLAQHYGIEFPQDGNATWREIDDASAYGRGGLLPMSVFLTKNAPGLRTSPVKRGYWVIRRLLGEVVPPPPPDVPELPASEADLGEQTLREALAMHRDHAACASCHQKIDSIGLVFEGFGPVGERRMIDLGGRKIDDSALFPDGIQRVGIAGLQEYLRAERADEFRRNVASKLLAYALGRTLILGDQVLIQSLVESDSEQPIHFRSLIEGIVTSDAFLTKRGRTNQHDRSIASGDSDER